MRLENPHKLVIATHNAGKLREMRELLATYPIALISAGELGLAEPEETGASFVSNALIKAKAASESAHLPAFADDSGLCVDALGGAPGIFSARWAGENKDFAAAMTRIEQELVAASAQPPYTAHFVSVLAIAFPDREVQTFEGKVFGQLVFPGRGTLGFGYDPIFLPDGHDLTFGEMGSIQKHGLPKDGSLALSHRARAFQLFAKACLIK
jgi:XTP/dITP diphosphohydrolase